MKGPSTIIMRFPEDYGDLNILLRDSSDSDCDSLIEILEGLEFIYHVPYFCQTAEIINNMIELDFALL